MRAFWISLSLVAVMMSGCSLSFGPDATLKTSFKGLAQDSHWKATLRVNTPKQQTIHPLDIWRQDGHLLIRVKGGSPEKDNQYMYAAGRWIRLKKGAKAPQDVDRDAPFLGSDFSLRDLFQAASYREQMTGEERVSDQVSRTLEYTAASDEAAWARILFLCRKSPAVPMKIDYSNAQGHLIKTAIFYQRVPYGDSALPTRWEMERKHNNPGQMHYSTFNITHYELNPSLPDEMFHIPHSER